MKNIEKYKEIVLKHLSHCDIETDIRKQGGKAAIDCSHTSCDECQEKYFKWLLSEYKEPLLNQSEKEYLSQLVKLFENEITEIIKYRSSTNDSLEYLVITGRDNIYFRLPKFSANTMYKGMKCGESYTLKELGL